MSTDNRTSTTAEASKPATAEVQATKIVTVGEESGRGEVSAATIGRMLGLASVRELNLLDGKIELLMSKINNMSAKVERVVSILGSAPTGKDLERIDVQLAAIRTQLREMGSGEAPQPQPAPASTTGGVKRPKIVSTEGGDESAGA